MSFTIRRNHTWMIAALALSLAACGGGDGDPPVDAGRTGSDGGGGGTDGGNVDGGPRADGGGAADGGAMVDGGGDPVARCMAASAALATTCTGDGNRTCHVGAYATYCNAEGAPGLFADAMDCLRAMSSAGSCRTFADPSGADGCIDAVYAGHTRAAVAAIGTRVTTVCAESFTPQRAEPPLYAMTDAELASLQTCIDAATDCGAVDACAEAAAATILACYTK